MKNVRTLRDCHPGEWIQILHIEDPVIHQKALSLGIGEGSLALCVIHLPHGPGIFLFGRQQIAFGFTLCAQIQIERILHP